MKILVSLDMCAPDHHFFNTAHTHVEYTVLPWSLPSAGHVRSCYCHNRGNQKSCMYCI